MNALNPDLNNIRGIRLSMNDYGPLNTRGDRKAAASSVKNLLRRLLSGSHQEQVIVIDNTNEYPSSWTSLFSVSEPLDANVLGIGIQICENEHPDNIDQKNEQDPNVQLFKAMMYKYMQVENEQDIDDAISVLLAQLTN